MLMFVKFYQSSLCNIPAFFYPTTVLMVDDDVGFLKATALELVDTYKTVTFSDSNEAIAFLTRQNGAFFRGRLLAEHLEDGILAFRNEPYNARRFDDVLVSIVDYDMPNKSGFDVMQYVGLSDYYKSHEHSYILLTAKKYNDFDKELAEDRVGKNFISKFDDNHLRDLLLRINQQATDMFQGVCHSLTTSLTKNPQEKTSFLNDGNFLPILNDFLKAHNICEGYLFDKQGSLMMLDNDANLYWLFVRNTHGMVNSIEKAKQYHAPQSVIEALESKKFILSLYEKADFESRTHIDWDKYLLKADVFKDENKKLEVFNHCPSDYYYVFTKDFPEHGIDRSKILSYSEFLKTK